ncbi:MAG: hypothetical protein ACM30H_09780 [Clostridia bacterium]
MRLASIALIGSVLAASAGSALAEDCAYYRQKAEESRAAAREQRGLAAKMGNDGSSMGGVSGSHIQAAQAYETAAAQYEQKFAACGAGRAQSSAPAGRSGGAKAAQAIGNVIQQWQQTPSHDDQTFLATPQEAEAAQREAAALREKQRGGDSGGGLADLVDQEMAKNEQTAKQNQFYQFNFGRQGGSGKGEDFSNYDDPRCQACRDIGASPQPSGDAEWDTEHALRLAVERDSCIITAGGCGGRVTYDAYNADSKILREYLESRQSSAPCSGCALPAR